MPNLDPLLVRSLILFCALGTLGGLAFCYLDFGDVAVGSAIQATMLLFWGQEAVVSLRKTGQRDDVERNRKRRR